MSESLFTRSVRVLGAATVHAQLAAVRAAEYVRDLPPDLEAMTALDALDWCWPLIGRPEQQTPVGDWITWVVLAGRGWGKSRTASQFVVATAEEAGRQIAAGTLAVEQAKILVVAPTSADLRDVCVEGDGGILRSSPPWSRPIHEPSKRRLTWPTGVEAVLISADEVDRIRGVQGIAAWGDEIATWPKLAEAFSNLRFAVRLGQRPRICLTTTPRRRKELRDIIE
ncbi:MAG TPA: terminase family protein, partial [Polyangia bacterium]|nr:terminase family protein [Polyangia bacterium]